jgi:hypothetical protein
MNKYVQHILILSLFMTGPANSKLKGSSMTQLKQKCTRVWVDQDAILESTNMHETISFSRLKKEIKTRVHQWSDRKDLSKEQTKILDQKAFADLDQFLSALCLARIENEPPPPPGGPANIVIQGSLGPVRLGWRGNTGGDYFLLTEENIKSLYEKLRKYGP